MVQFTTGQPTRSASRPASRAGGAARRGVRRARAADAAGSSMIEGLEPRQLLALLGIAPLDQLPLTFYNSTGQLNYDAATDAFDAVATPTAVLLPGGPPRAFVNPQHGDIQLHIRVNGAGGLTRGAQPGDSSVIGSVNGAGDDLVINGAIDLDGNGIIDPGETGVMLTAEVMAMGFQDSGAGGTTDQYDFRLRPTGGILSTMFTGSDIGMTLTSENSTFGGGFGINFIGGAKGSLGPTPVLTGALRGTKFLDVGGNGLSADDTPLAGTRIYLDSDNDGVFDAAEPNVLTGADGSYEFTGLTPGLYRVREVVPTGFVRTGPVLVNGYSVSVVAGSDSEGNDFANAMICDRSTVSGITYLINGTRVVTDLRGNTNQGDQVCVTFTIAPGTAPHVYSLVSYTAPGRTFVAADAHEQRIFDVDTGTFGPGTHTLCIMLPDCNYQVDFVCGPPIDVFGPAGSNIFYSPQGRLFSADNDGCDDCLPSAALISGAVWIDADCDGNKDSGEDGLAGVRITLTGSLTGGGSVSIVKLTNSQGLFSFGNLRPGTYRLTETQPAGFSNGATRSGTPGTVITTNRISNIVLGPNGSSTDNRFGDFRISGVNAVLRGDTASAGFWDSNNGQNLIRSFNGGPNARTLSATLASLLPRLYGSQAGSNNLTNKTNAQVASHFRMLNDQSNSTNAQVLALALSAYATNSDAAGGTMAARYGFNVTSGGILDKTCNVGGAGAAFGVSNNSNCSIGTMLSMANSRASGGNAFGSSSSYRSAAAPLFVGANDAGGLV